MSRISQVTPKIKWAYKHIAELETAILAFKGTDPYAVMPKRDSETGRIKYCVAEAPDVPVEISLLSGEIIQNLRSALEYLIVQLLDVEGKKPNSRTGFPIYNTVKSFEADPFRKIELIPKAVRDRQDQGHQGVQGRERCALETPLAEYQR
jgi:hypothetical protein